MASAEILAAAAPRQVVRSAQAGGARSAIAARAIRSSGAPDA
jgi:hypothetical protein